jgi:pilus assembly protein CpaF
MSNLLSLERRQNIAEQALDHLMSPLHPILADASVTEVMINAHDQIWVEQSGKLSPVLARIQRRGVHAINRLLASQSQTHSLEKDGILESHWRGWRVTGVLPPVSRDSACLCLRRHRAEVLDLAQWRMQAFDQRIHEDSEIADEGTPHTDQKTSCSLTGNEWPSQSLKHGFASILKEAHGVLISGSTGSGKTTFLGSLIAQIPATERVVSIEDTPELPVACPHQLRLIARQGHSIRSLVRLALRLRPDRIVIGEVRGAEAFDMLQAMSTGHAGCLGTIHASSALGALLRMEQLILTAQLDWPIEAIRTQLAEWIRVLVHLSRDAGGRCIREVLRVEGVENGKFVVSPLPLFA